jgi:hypothetical protein
VLRKLVSRQQPRAANSALVLLFHASPRNGTHTPTQRFRHGQKQRLGCVVRDSNPRSLARLAMDGLACSYQRPPQRWLRHGAQSIQWTLSLLPAIGCRQNIFSLLLLVQRNPSTCPSAYFRRPLRLPRPKFAPRPRHSRGRPVAVVNAKLPSHHPALSATKPRSPKSWR